MSIFATPVFSYAYNSGFDFRSYHERILVSEHTVRGVDKALMKYANKQIDVQNASDEQLTKIADAVGNLERTTKIGFVELVVQGERTNAHLESIDDGIQGIQQVLIDGFDGLRESILRLESQLSNIAQLLENPERAWAFEQYNKGLKLYRKGLLIEAVDCFLNALNGAGRGLGDSTEYRFHFMLGSCYLGTGSSLNIGLIDTMKAQEHLEKAAKYYGVSEQEQSRVKASLWASAGWAAYCNGDMRSAKANYETAWACGQTDETGYGLLKVLLHSDRTENIETVLNFLLLNQRQAFLARAATDPDFIKHRQLIFEAADACKQQVRTISAKAADVITEQYDALSSIVERHSKTVSFSGFEKSEIEAKLEDWKNKTVQEFGMDLSSMAPPFEYRPFEELEKRLEVYRGAFEKASEDEKHQSREFKRHKKAAKRHKEKFQGARAQKKLSRIVSRLGQNDGLNRYEHLMFTPIVLLVVVAFVMTIRDGFKDYDIDAFWEVIFLAVAGTLFSPITVFSYGEFFGVAAWKIYYGLVALILFLVFGVAGAQPDSILRKTVLWIFEIIDSLLPGRKFLKAFEASERNLQMLESKIFDPWERKGSAFCAVKNDLENYKQELESARDQVKSLESSLHSLLKTDWQESPVRPAEIDIESTDVEVGKVYRGKVVRLTDFGAFVNILPGVDGLVHILEISDGRIERVSDKLGEGDIVYVKVLEADKGGRVRLTMRNISGSR